MHAGDHVIHRRIGLDSRGNADLFTHLLGTVDARRKLQQLLFGQVAAVPQSGHGGQVVRRDARNGFVRILRRLAILETDECIRQHVMLGQFLPHSVLDGPQVLANHERFGPHTLQRNDVEQIVDRIADVSSILVLKPSGIQNERNRPST